MYTFFHLKQDISRFKKAGCEVGVVGKTFLGCSIPYVFLGDKNDTSVIVVGATHAREHITSLLVARQIYYYLTQKINLFGGIYFVPMLNIDGVRLCHEGVDFISSQKQRDFLTAVNNGYDFALWKANANAVDINVNFDAEWGTGASNVTFPSSANYIGTHAMSECETVALADFTQKINPDYVISYHAKGQEIYWQFFQDEQTKARDFRYANYVAKYTGYTLKDQTKSAGGYKDWCVQKLGIPAITVEVGDDRFDHPYPYSQIDDIVAKNLLVPQKMLNTIFKEKQNGQKVYESSHQRS